MLAVISVSIVYLVVMFVDLLGGCLSLVVYVDVGVFIVAFCLFDFEFLWVLC